MKRAMLVMGLLLGIGFSMGTAAVHATSLDVSPEPSIVSFDGAPEPICPLPRGCPVPKP